MSPRLSIILILFTALFSKAQLQSPDHTFAGIYTTYEDFKTGKLSYSSDCDHEKPKIRVHSFLQKAYIDVIHQGNKIRLQKSDLFGYQDCYGTVFRFYCNREYTLAEIRAISIYYIEEPVPWGATFVQDRVFYFSTVPDGVLIPLSVENLKKVYPQNTKFQVLLDSEIKTDADLWRYDELRCIFKVNDLYAISLH
jgi:hypothetical protein